MPKICEFEKQGGRGETYFSCLPFPLPPEPLDLIVLQKDLEKAMLALGRLDAIGVLLPDPHLFIYTYLRKEAVLSSQIEGTQSSLSDLLSQENSFGVPKNLDMEETLCYVKAINYGLQCLSEGFPICSRLIKEIHKILLTSTRGKDKEPGEFRRSQNWIGGTRPGNAFYVPPAPDKVLELMSDLEKFIHREEDTMPFLIKIALVHVQFETIHPFLDGNGRLGRLLITLLLCEKKILTQPILYLSLFFKTYQSTYYERLQSVRTKGEWEIWIQFFLEGVATVAKEATQTALQITKLFEENRKKMKDAKNSRSVAAVLSAFEKSPVQNSKDLVRNTELSLGSVLSAIEQLTSLGILEARDQKIRGRSYGYKTYLDLLNKEKLEPLG